jgi:hypothetical protein
MTTSPIVPAIALPEVSRGLHSTADRPRNGLPLARLTSTIATATSRTVYGPCPRRSERGDPRSRGVHQRGRATRARPPTQSRSRTALQTRHARQPRRAEGDSPALAPDATTPRHYVRAKRYSNQPMQSPSRDLGQRRSAEPQQLLSVTLISSVLRIRSNRIREAASRHVGRPVSADEGGGCRVQVNFASVRVTLRVILRAST